MHGRRTGIRTERSAPERPSARRIDGLPTPDLKDRLDCAGYRSPRGNALRVMRALTVVHEDTIGLRDAPVTGPR